MKEWIKRILNNVANVLVIMFAACWGIFYSVSYNALGRQQNKIYLYFVTLFVLAIVVNFIYKWLFKPAVESDKKIMVGILIGMFALLLVVHLFKP